MAMQQIPLPGELVKKSNAIARSRWQPESIWEPRIVALVASKVHADDKDFCTYRIPIAELTGADCKNFDGQTYQKIRNAILHLAKASILIPSEKNPHNFMSYTIFSACGYEDGYLIARFDPDMKPHFLQLKKYTAYNLFEYLLLPSSYSQHLFEFIKSWANESSTIISVAELHELLNTPPSFRADFKAFRVRVLEKAHKDIHAKTSLRYAWEPVKRGKRVESIRFIFSHDRLVVAEALRKKDAQAKQSASNNRKFIKAIECSEKKGRICSVQDNKPQICAVCRQVGAAASLTRLPMERS